MASTTPVAWLELPVVSPVFAVLVDGWYWWLLYLGALFRGVVMSLLGRGGKPGLSGSSFRPKGGGGDRLPCLLDLWFRGKAAADRTFRMLLAR